MESFWHLALQNLINVMMLFLALKVFFRDGRRASATAESEHVKKHVIIDEILKNHKQKLEDLERKQSLLESDIYAEIANLRTLVEDKFNTIYNILITIK